MPGPIRRVGTLLRYASEPIEVSVAETLWVDPATRRALYSRSMGDLVHDHRANEHQLRALSVHPPGLSLATSAMDVQLRTMLVDDYLAKVDIGTMAVGLEARCPFLDVELVELAMKIPEDVRFRKGRPKSVLRRLAARHLPREVFTRRKRGFVAPVGRWLRTEWTDMVDDLVLGPNVERRGLFERAALNRIVGEHRGGRDRGYLLWSLMVLEQWQRFLFGEAASPTAG
jgi:asparagine synthase (glutamine-hydrolysing)